jgi:hypothetical protein
VHLASIYMDIGAFSMNSDIAVSVYADSGDAASFCE